MNDPLQDERISAYLDGEMTVEERAEFEQLLSADPERRQLLEELRALSASLGGLPKEKLGDPFSDQVLRKAERAVLTQSAAADKAHEEPHGPPQVGSIYKEPVLPIGYSRRGWVWASLAVAAALVLMIRLQDPDSLGPKVAKRQPALGEATMRAVDELASVEDTELERDKLVQDGAMSSTLDSSDRVATEEGRAKRLSGMLREPAAAESPVSESPVSESPVSESSVSESSIAGPRPTSQVMVVHLDMRADAADQSKLNQVLVSNGIACDVRAQYGIPNYRPADRGRPGGFGGGGGTASKKRADEDVVYEDVVYVEASYEQIARTLQQLHDNARDFPAVEVDPAPDVPTQQAFIGNSRGRASNRWARKNEDHPAASERVAKLGRAAKSEAAPLDVQLQSVFADRLSADASGKDLAQAARVPARQRKVAEQIVLDNRAFYFKNKNESEASDDESRPPQQKPSGARSWYRSDDRVYVLFVLNVVEALGGETSKSETIQPSAAAKTIEPQRTPRNTEE